MSRKNTGAIIPAAGMGLRYLSVEKKLLSLIKDEPLLLYTLKNFLKHQEINPIVVVVPEGERELFTRILPVAYKDKDIRIVEGGKSRAMSVYQGFSVLKDEVEVVLIHDGARPLVSAEIINQVILTAWEKGSAIPVLPVYDNVALCDANNCIAYTLSRDDLRLIQTPQGFRVSWLLAAYQQIEDFASFSDEGSIIEKAGYPIFAVAGDQQNLKVTVKDDIAYAEYIMEKEKL